MTTQKDGGPAFPRASGPAQLGVNTTAREGMSLRDWFAGQALASRGLYGANVREKEVAAECYAIADAMLAEREKRVEEMRDKDGVVIGYIHKFDCTEPDRKNCPRKCEDFCNEAERERKVGE